MNHSAISGSVALRTELPPTDEAAAESTEPESRSQALYRLPGMGYDLALDP